MAERAVELDIGGLRWDTGAPTPVLIVGDYRTLLAFYIPDLDAIEGKRVRTAELVRCTSVQFGFPNDETLQGHRLWGQGLTFYALHEVYDSTWIELLRSIERVHPAAPAVPFPDAKHFILAFHDSTLEAIATRIVPLDTYSSMPEAVLAMAGAVQQNAG